MSDLYTSNIQELVQTLAKLMIAKKFKLATAESCTGGMLSQRVTALSGSSEWFECGFITYSNDLKISLLGVQAKVLDEFGAVSKEVAEQMALGTLQNCAADIAVSITGIAGPRGGSTAKPVGTVYIATAKLNQSAKAKHYHFKGNREVIRKQTTHAAIKLVVDQLS